MRKTVKLATVDCRLMAPNYDQPTHRPLEIHTYTCMNSGGKDYINVKAINIEKGIIDMFAAVADCM